MTTLTAPTQSTQIVLRRRTIRIRSLNAALWVSRLNAAGVPARFLGPGSAKKYNDCGSLVGKPCSCRICKDPMAWGNLEFDGIGGNKAHKIFSSAGGYPDEASDSDI